MFSNLGWSEIALLAVIGLVVFGPERLPEVMRTCAHYLHLAREYLSRANEELHREIGPELDELRQPLQEIHQLGSINPQRLFQEHLLKTPEKIPPPQSRESAQQYPPTKSQQAPDSPFDHEAT